MDIVADLGEGFLPNSIKEDPNFLYWAKTRSYRVKAKKLLDKINFGEIENNLTIKAYKEIMMMSGKTKKESDIAGAKLYLARKNAG